MKRIIDGVTYNTDTAEWLCTLPCHTEDVNSFDYHDTSLYMTRKGRFFLHGEGGARSMWAEPRGNGSMIGGEGIVPCSPEDARMHLEAAGDTEWLERLWPEVEEGDDIEDEVRSTMRWSAALRQRASDAAAAQGVSLNTFVMRAVGAALNAPAEIVTGAQQ